MITGLQCKLARTALGMSNADLAQASGVGVNTVSRFEQGGDTRRSSIEAVQQVLEAGGIVFVAAGEASLSGGAGVRLKA